MQSLALYVHWPFCLAKCPYCDFNSHVRDRIDHGRWRKALLAELDQTADRVGPRTLTSIFFGGGTPSLMEPETVAAVIDRAMDYWSPDPQLEVTLEANPTSVEADRFEGYRQAGVKRVSLGVQALTDKDLMALGRQHSAAEALKAVELARRYFDRLSFDLIYASNQRCGVRRHPGSFKEMRIQGIQSCRNIKLIAVWHFNTSEVISFTTTTN